MHQVSYDGTFIGLLSAIFDVYEQRFDVVNICRADNEKPDFFAERFHSKTERVKAARVWNGLSKKLSGAAADQVYNCFLSEDAGIENVLLAYVRYAFSAAQNIEADFGNAAVLLVAQTARKVWREKHRMEAFVRFQEMKDGLYYALIEPDHNVLPVILPHFKSRYADQDWLIYDGLRKYGIYYNHHSETVEEVLPEWTSKTDLSDAYDEDEPRYQQLWKDYFHHTGIPARKNEKLHLRHIPHRYWKHLIEKQ